MKKLALVAAALSLGCSLAAAAPARTDGRVWGFDPVTFRYNWIAPDGPAKRGRSTANPVPREVVAYAGPYSANTIVIDTSERRLYYVLGDGTAVKYGVGVGREGFQWTGTNRITRKAEWPGWTPPPAMRKRKPDLPAYMEGGPNNPLGARAMYLGSTVYRIHGTNQPSTIGKFVSSGCIGMLNEDVSDLFERTKVGTRVVVMPGGPPPGTATAAAPPAAGTATAAAAPPPPPLGVPGGQPTVVAPLPPPTTIR